MLIFHRLVEGGKGVREDGWVDCMYRGKGGVRKWGAEKEEGEKEEGEKEGEVIKEDGDGIVRG